MVAILRDILFALVERVECVLHRFGEGGSPRVERELESSPDRTWVLPGEDLGTLTECIWEKLQLDGTCITEAVVETPPLIENPDVTCNTQAVGSGLETLNRHSGGTDFPRSFGLAGCSMGRVGPTT
ncbi:hypothetical protein BDM02DRAFT_3123180 [Thelephora ganbajun]|uniref:Uncharacterized protein n=1 Tax=Thelephora ganbajun TaxID=370292 RepID=A0ACB6Z3B6_THEGA|nr:hypothetical protein BDM02DRAFT_3123180 [Thelephora ganbajun]